MFIGSPEYNILLYINIWLYSPSTSRTTVSFRCRVHFINSTARSNGFQNYFLKARANPIGYAVVCITVRNNTFLFILVHRLWKYNDINVSIRSQINFLYFYFVISTVIICFCYNPNVQISIYTIMFCFLSCTYYFNHGMLTSSIIFA